MEKKLNELDERLQELEHVDTGAYIEDLEFSIVEAEPVQLGSGEKAAGLPSVLKSSGNQRRWRETRDTRGAVKYCNWSVGSTVMGSDNKPVKCDWIKVSNCNHRIKQATTVAEASSINFTTDNQRGWNDIVFVVRLKHKGIIYDPVNVRLA